MPLRSLNEYWHLVVVISFVSNSNSVRGGFGLVGSILALIVRLLILVISRGVEAEERVANMCSHSI